MNHIVWIVWGEDPDEGTPSMPYMFDTDAERLAFLRGVAEAQGWMDYRIVDGDGHVDADGNFVAAE